MKEKYYWIAGVILFVCGFIFRNMSFGSKFGEVENIHDLFEMFSSAATVIAVFVAWKGINVWRFQARGQADLELARRLSRVALDVKDLAVSACVDAMFAVRQVPFGAAGLHSVLLE